jgi:predicted AlkP superfamily pyrophosphatase or phosphodiesterase
MKKTVVINVVGLSASLIGEHTPFLSQWKQDKSLSYVEPQLPAVTTSMQATYLTGKIPSQHGIVGNAWYDRDECEVKCWKQSNKLIQAPKLYDQARAYNPQFTCAKLFWWYNMYSGADFSVTPRPNYLADGRKEPDCYSHPADLRDRLQQELGTFPLFSFWGPATSIASSRWIAQAAMLTDKWHQPTLNLIYLPHLDYALQKFGNNKALIAKDLQQIDQLCQELIAYFEAQDTQVIVLSEYGITDVSHPVHLNRLFREQGWLALRREQSWELLDAGASAVFAVADHQLAHVYLNKLELLPKVKALLERTPGVEQVLDMTGKQAAGIDHPRAGDLVAVADAQSWFTYYYWQEDAKAPDFARTVEIHKKPGYDPVEMFFDKQNPLIKLRAAYKLGRKKLGFRYRMDVISLDATLIKGSHGRTNVPDAFKPVFISAAQAPLYLAATEVYTYLWKQVFEEMPPDAQLTR